MRGDELINLVGRRLCKAVEEAAEQLGRPVDEVCALALEEFLIQVAQLAPGQWEDWEDRSAEQMGFRGFEDRRTQEVFLSAPWNQQ